MTAGFLKASCVHVDEVGLAFAVVGGFRVQTAFQPVFERRGSVLAPVAVTASSVIRRDGGGLTGPGDLGAGDRAAAAQLAPELAIRNLKNFDAEIDDLQLVVDGPARIEQPDDLAALLAIARSAGVSPRCLAFDIAACAPAGGRSAFVDALADQGASVCIDLSGVPGLPPAAARCASRLVRIPSAMFGRILSAASARRLMTSLVSTLHKTGFLVQIEGLSTVEALRLAVDAGVDRLQGDLLAPSALAGAAFESTPCRLADLVGTDRNVVSISA